MMQTQRWNEKPRGPKSSLSGDSALMAKAIFDGDADRALWIFAGAGALDWQGICAEAALKSRKALAAAMDWARKDGIEIDEQALRQPRRQSQPEKPPKDKARDLAAFDLLERGGSLRDFEMRCADGADELARLGERSGRSMVHAAALGAARQSSQPLETLERLVLLGADIDAKDAHGSTALLLAIEQAIPEAVEALLAAGADPEASGFPMELRAKAIRAFSKKAKPFDETLRILAAAFEKKEIARASEPSGRAEQAAPRAARRI